jgi:hypothetical protein
VEIVIPKEHTNGSHPRRSSIRAHLISVTTVASSLKKGGRLHIKGIIVDQGYGAYMIYLKEAQQIK